MYSTCKWNKQGDNINRVQYMYSFPSFDLVSFSVFCSNCCFLNCIQVFQEAGNVVWYSHLFKNFAICWDPYSQRLYHSPWSRSKYFFLEFPCFPHDPTNVENLISASLISLPLQNPAYAYGSFQFTNYWSPAWKIFDHNLATMWNEHNSIIIFWTFFGIALWDWYENWPFPVLWPLLNFPNLLIYGIYKRVMDF